MPNSLKPRKTNFQSLTGASTQVPSMLKQLTQPQPFNNVQKPNFQLATGQSVRAPAPNLETMRATGRQSASMSRPTGSALQPTAPPITSKLSQNEQTMVQQPSRAPQTFTTPSGATGTVDELRALASPQVAQPQPFAIQPTSTPQMAAPQVQPSQISAIQSQLQDTFRMTPEEVQLQQQLNNLLTSEEMGIEQIRNQTIAMPFITGQAAAVQRQAATQATPLQRQLALLQAQRQGEQQALESQLSFQQGEREFAASQQPATQTGSEPIKVGDQLVQLNPLTGQYESVFNAGIGGGGISGGIGQEAQSWAELVKSGQAKLSDVPSDIRTQVAGALGQLPVEQSAAQKRATEQANVAIQNIDQALQTIPEVGLGAIGRQFGSLVPGTDARDLQQQITTVKALIGFDQLQKMREASPTGGALGQVSERELSFLQSVAGSLDVGQSREQLESNLIRVKQSFQRLRAISNPTITAEEYAAQFPDASDDEILEILQREQQSFNQVGGDTNQAVAIPQSSRLAFVNNNPGNLRFAGQQGAVQGEGGFARFSSPQAGFEALKQQIQLDAGRGLTLAQFINKYAPPSENNTQQYIQQIQQMTGANPNTPVQSIDLNQLARAIARKESSTNIA